MPRVTIDGHDVVVGESSTILASAASAGVDIPTLCADARLAPSGACRLCVVAVDGLARPVAACTTPVDDGMVVHTHPPEVEELRHTLLRMLAIDYPASAVADAPSQLFHQLLDRYGLTGEAVDRADPALVDDSHPLIHVDLARCISCRRCVRICDEVQGQFVWSITGRGAEARIVPDSGTTLADSSCVACGACVDTCPTGALEDRALVTIAAPPDWTRTTCPYCAVGCQMEVGTRHGDIVAIRPARSTRRPTGATSASRAATATSAGRAQA